VTGSRRGIAFLLAAGVTALTLLFAGSVQAATFAVNSTVDPGTGGCTVSECTLREAINATNGNGSVDRDVVNLVVTGTITPTGSLPAIATPANLNGPGAGSLTVNGGAPVFEITSPGDVHISDLSITGGSSSADKGGGVYVSADGFLDLVHVAIYNNVSDYGGGGIKSEGILFVSGSTIGNANPALGNCAAGLGGGIWNSGYMRIDSSSILGNCAVVGGGGIDNTATGNSGMSTSTIAGNSTDGGGGGVTNNGANFNILNATFSSNVAGDFGGAVDTFGVDASTLLDSSTIADNRANDDGDGFGDGGGTQSGTGPPAGVTVVNSLYRGNTVGGAATGAQCSGFDHISLGYNLSQAVHCGGFTGPGDIVDNALALAPLADNGGATMTRALTTGSSAVDAGNPASPGGSFPACASTDQRGIHRVGRCDIGAFELEATVSPRPGPTPAAQPTGQRAAALKKCTKKKSKKARKKCKKKARKLPV
jgi:CSLREA domain-containing protein